MLDYARRLELLVLGVALEIERRLNVARIFNDLLKLAQLRQLDIVTLSVQLLFRLGGGIGCTHVKGASRVKQTHPRFAQRVYH